MSAPTRPGSATGASLAMGTTECTKASAITASSIVISSSVDLVGVWVGEDSGALVIPTGAMAIPAGPDF